jgi:hypothetical protein
MVNRDMFDICSGCSILSCTPAHDRIKSSRLVRKRYRFISFISLVLGRLISRLGAVIKAYGNQLKGACLTYEENQPFIRSQYPYRQFPISTLHRS